MMKNKIMAYSALAVVLVAILAILIILNKPSNSDIDLKFCKLDSDCYEYSPCGMGISCWNEKGYEKEQENDVYRSCPAVQIMPWQSYRYNKEVCACLNNTCTNIFSKEKYCNSLNFSISWCGNKTTTSNRFPEYECKMMMEAYDKDCK